MHDRPTTGSVACASHCAVKHSPPFFPHPFARMCRKDTQATNFGCLYKKKNMLPPGSYHHFFAGFCKSMCWIHLAEHPAPLLRKISRNGALLAIFQPICA